MAPMSGPKGAMVARVGMPRAAMGHARPMALPMPSHVSAIVEAMKAHAEAHGQGMGRHGLRLLINCHAGLGRSPAMGIVALMAWGMAAPDAVRAVAAALPEASPNRLILRHAEALMGQPIVPHAEAAWAYRRGPAGAQGEPVGLRVVGGHPPLTGPLVETSVPEAVVAPFRPVVGPLPPRVAVLRPAVAAPVPEAVAVPLVPSVTPPCSVAAPASPGSSGGRVALPAFLAALLPAVAPEPCLEPVAPPVPPPRPGTSLGGLRPSLPPAAVAPEDVPPPRAPAAPVAAAPRPEPIVVTLAPAVAVVPAALPRPPEPKTKAERISLLGSIIAQARAKLTLAELGEADARMAELKALARMECRRRV